MSGKLTTFVFSMGFMLDRRDAARREAKLRNALLAISRPYSNYGQHW